MFRVSSSPHVRSKDTTSRIMLDVIIALLPAVVAGAVFFGLRTLMVVAVAIASAVACEALTQKFMKKAIKIGDFSAAVTGLLLALNLPPAVPLWIPLIGSAFAIIIVKMLFGGIGHNFVNPALAARVFLVAAWPVVMTTWSNPLSVDAVASATPMAIIKGTAEGSAILPSITDMAIGNIGGCLGETSAIALLAGGLYLLARRVISWHIPVAFIGTIFVTGLFFGSDAVSLNMAMYYVLGGGVMIGAIFMATDYTTSPVTKKGQLIMGLGCGILTFVIRKWGGYPEGVSFSILLMNIAAPLIERATTPRVFGEVKPNA